MSPIIFEPWTPPGDDPRFRGVRLLLVGESHYDEGESYTLEQQRLFTTDVVRRWGFEGEGYQRFFANIYRTLIADEAPSSPLAYRAFWESAFFYNYVQSFVAGGPRARPTAQQFAQSGEAFHAILDDVRPDAALVMSKATWSQMSARDAVLIERDAEGLGDIWCYGRSRGATLVAHTHHPSSPGYSAAAWRGRVSRFLDRARADL